MATWIPHGVKNEGDQRHVEICMFSLEIDGNSRSAGTPIDKDVVALKENELLDQSDSTRYRGLVTKMNDLGQEWSSTQS